LKLNGTAFSTGRKSQRIDPGGSPSVHNRQRFMRKWNPHGTEYHKREWVGLTDEEVEKCIALANPIAIFEEVEAKLKAKNT
jgi:hypothetical protein